MFYFENFVERGIIYRYLIVEYPWMLTETRWGCLHCVVKQLTKRKKNQLTGLCILERQETVSFVRTEPLLLFTTVSPASRMGLIAAQRF